MNADKLFQIGENHYHNGPKIPEAIKAFEKLVNLYPEHVKGWEYLATMYYSNTEFDKWLEAINSAINLDPSNIRLKENKNTSLSLLSKFTFAAPYFLNESTKEAYTINGFKDQTEIKIALFDSISELAELNKDDPTKTHGYYMKKAHLKRDFKEFDSAVEFYKASADFIPSNYSDDRKTKTLQNIEKLIASALQSKGDYQKSLEHLEKAFELGLDDFSRMQEADILEKMNEPTKAKLVLENLVLVLENKLKAKPEQAYISQQIQVLLRLQDKKRARLSLKYFDFLQDNDFHRSRKEKFIEQIENYS